MLRIAKRNFFSNQFEIHKSDAKSTWKVITNVLNNKSKSASINNITFNNSEVQDPKMIAEIFNNYFVNIGPNLAHDIPNTNIEVRTFLENAQFQTMFLSPVTADEVLALVNKMKPKKSSGFDGITNFCY